MEIKIIQDEDPESPREWDNLGTMVCWHRNYNLGDKNEFASNEAFLEWWRNNGAGGILLPLYLYDHSGITMSTGPFWCPWDSGQVGWIYVTAEKIRQEYSVKRISHANRTRARQVLEGEVQTYDQYLTGDVWGFVIEHEGAHLESCFGMFGRGYCQQQAEEAAKHIDVSNLEAAVNVP